MTDTIEEQIAKLKYHVSVLSGLIDSDEFPVPKMILDLDLDSGGFYRIHDAFRKYRGKLESGETFSHTKFEMSCGVDSDGLKTIIDVYVKQGHYVDVCFAYIKSTGEPYVAEYNLIMASEPFQKWLEKNS